MRSRIALVVMMFVGLGLAATSAALAQESPAAAARAAADRWDYAEARRLYAQALAEQAAAGQTADTSWVEKLGFAHNMLGQHVEAEGLYRQHLARLNEQPATDAIARANLIEALAYTQDLQGKYDQAEQLYRLLIRHPVNQGPDRRYSLAIAWNNLGANLDEQGRHVEATAAFEQALSIARDIEQADIMVGALLINQGAGMQDGNDYAAALPLLREGIDIYVRSEGRDDPKLIQPISRLAQSNDAVGRQDEAQTLHQEALKLAAPFGLQSYERIFAEHGLARHRLRWGQAEAALNQLRTINAELLTSSGRGGHAVPRGRAALTLGHQLEVQALWEAGGYRSAHH